MSYDFYKIFHLGSVFVLLLTLGALWAFYSLEASSSDRFKKYLLTFHGIFTFLIFVAGFGLIARLQIPTPWPAWIYIKIFLWLIIGASPFLLKKGIKPPHKKLKSRALFWFLLLLAFFALLTARLKF